MWGMDEGGGLTPHEGTARRAAVQFFDPDGRGGAAVSVCAVARAALSSIVERIENFMVILGSFWRLASEIGGVSPMSLRSDTAPW